MSDGATTEYFAYDGLGSVRQLTDPAGDVLLTQTFDPYGSLYARAGEDVTSFGYTGAGAVPWLKRYAARDADRRLCCATWRGMKSKTIHVVARRPSLPYKAERKTRAWLIAGLFLLLHFHAQALARV